MYYGNQGLLSEPATSIGEKEKFIFISLRQRLSKDVV